MKYKYCSYCPLDGTCENQDRGYECEMPIKKLLEENQQLEKKLEIAVNTLKKIEILIALNLVDKSKISTAYKLSHQAIAKIKENN